MTFEQALQIKTEEVTKDSYRCFDDLLHTHIHKGWLLQVIEEAAELYAKSKWEEACEEMIETHTFEYVVIIPEFKP